MVFYRDTECHDGCRIRWNAIREGYQKCRDEVLIYSVYLRWKRCHGYCKRSQQEMMSWMPSVAEERIQVSCRGKEKEGVMGVTDDGHAVLLFVVVPWQQSQGLLQLAKQWDREPNSRACVIPREDSLLFTCMCAQVWPLHLDPYRCPWRWPAA